MATSHSAHRYIAYRRRRRNGQGMPRILMAFIVLTGLTVFGVGLVAGIGYGVYQHYADGLVPPDVVIASQPSGGARILDRNGKPLYEFLDDKAGLRQPVKIEDISPWLVYATVVREDSSFFTNPGVNYKGLGAAAWSNFSPFGNTPGFLEGRGGSSITQQLVKNVYFTREEQSKRSVSRKLKETIYAIELTKKYSGNDVGSARWKQGKSQIMEWYLNQISYASVYVGAEKAANGYFGKHAKDLTLAESATLAAIPASPNEYSPIQNPNEALRQRNIVLRSMRDEHYIDNGQLWDAVSQPLGASPHAFGVEAPHFVFNVVQPQLEAIFGEDALKTEGLVVYTSLDLDAERKAQDILEEQIQTHEEGAAGHNGAAVGIDPKTGEILVYIGSRDYFNDDILGQNDMAQALNSPGSSIKPFTYITAFINLNWGPGTLILDAPIPSKYWDGKNPPRNPISHAGPIPVRQALGNSLNIPAVKTILYAGVPEVIKQAKKMGITSLDGRDLGPSMTVGGVDVKLLDMVYGYTAFPNLGVLRGVQTTEDRPPGNRTLDPISILRVEDRSGKVLYPIVDGQPAPQPVPLEERVAPAQDAFLINDILSDPQAHCLTYGCGGLTIPGRPIGMKTGTSEPYEQIGLVGETWTFGFTPQLVFGTWFGNADNTPMNAGTNSYQVSAQTTKLFMIAYHENLPVETFTRPDGLVRASACIPSGMRATESCPLKTPEDWFAKPLAGDDTWWTVTKVDARTGRPAGPNTPKEFVIERRSLKVPDSASEFARDDALAWQYISGVPNGDAPTETPGAGDGLPAVITSPRDGDPVRGLINVRGTANSARFESYQLEFQSPLNPGSWTVIGSSDTPVISGVLGGWDTGVLVPGLYTLRLRVVDADAGDLYSQISVLVIINEDTRDNTPVPTIVAQP
jgi:membrane peptidoglycan carboxypeptidase